MNNIILIFHLNWKDLKVAFLGPFTTHSLRPFIPSLTEEEIKLAPGAGGMGLANLVIERLKNQKKSIVITLDSNLKSQLHKKGDFAELFAIPRRPRKVYRDLFKKECFYIQEAIRQSSPELINVHWTYEYALAALKEEIKIPVVITVRDHSSDVLKYSWRNYIPNYFITQSVFKKGKYFTTVSPHVYSLVARKTKSKVWLIENPVLEEYFQFTRNQDPANHTIVTSTLWNKLKNPKAALYAFSLIVKKYPNAVLYMAGKGMEFGGPGYLWAKRNGIEKNVEFVGNISNKDIIKLFQTASLYLHTSLTEACSMSIAEAMAIGLPVVGGKKSGGVPWQLDYGRSGSLVDVLNPTDIYEEVDKIFANAGLACKMSDNSKNRALKLFHPKNIEKQYDNLYNEILNLEM